MPADTRPLEIWPDGCRKDGDADSSEQSIARPDGVISVSNVTRPTISVYQADRGPVARPAALVCPGGGFGKLSINSEGTEPAEWLNSIGVTAVVLKYTVPGQRELAVADAQRAMRLIRHNARQWGLDTNRLGMVGFSAGAYLTARVSGGFDTPAYIPVDSADAQSCRPDFAVVVYPAYLAANGHGIAGELTVTAQHSPSFVVQTQDDRNHISSAIAYYAALTGAGVPAELHVFANGGHGKGLRYQGYEMNSWPQLCARWLAAIGMTAAD